MCSNAIVYKNISLYMPSTQQSPSSPVPTEILISSPKFVDPSTNKRKNTQITRALHLPHSSAPLGEKRICVHVTTTNHLWHMFAEVTGPGHAATLEVGFNCVDVAAAAAAHALLQNIYIRDAEFGNGQRRLRQHNYSAAGE